VTKQRGLGQIQRRIGPVFACARWVAESERVRMRTDRSRKVKPGRDLRDEYCQE